MPVKKYRVETDKGNYEIEVDEQAAAAQPPVAPKKTLTDTAVEWLPAVGGAVGGLAGNIPGAMLGAAAGEAYKQLVQRARGTRTGADPMAAATDIATSSVTQGAAPELGGAIVGKAMSGVAPRLMQSAVKPTLATLKDVAMGAPVPRIVKTLLDEGINVTKGGVQKLQRLLTASRAEIKDAITTAETSGAMISPHRVAARLTDTARKFASQVNPTQDLAAVGQAGNEFLAEHGGHMLSPSAAQELKQGTYAQLRKKYGQLGSADVESQKALARGLKEELETAAPGIGALNEAESKQFEALHAVGRRVAMGGNKDPIGFAWVTHNPMVFLTALMDRSPAVKSMLANGMYASAGAASKVAPDLIRAAMTAVATHDNGDQETTPAPNTGNPFR